MTCNCTAKESCIQVFNFRIHYQASRFVSRIMLNMALLLRVVNESEHVVVNQVEEEVNPSVEVGFDNCETSPELDFSVNRGKPRMHLNYGRTTQNSVLTEVLVFHQTLNTPKATTASSVRRAHPAGEPERSTFFPRIQ